MRKLIAVIVIVLVIWGILKLIGIDTSVTLKSVTGKEKGGKSLYEIWAEGNSYEDIIGVPLPEGATDAHASNHTEPYPGGKIVSKYSWVVAKLPKEDFYDLVDQLDLIKRPDLLEFWPEAFDCHQDEFIKFWDVQNVPNEDTYFGEGPEKETYRVFKYENGKVYIKKITKYIFVGFSNGKERYEKKGRLAIEHIIDAPFPKTATDLDVFSWNMYYGDILEQVCWAVAKLPKEDFYGLVDQLELVQSPDLLKIWPEAFNCEEYGFSKKQGFNKFWDVKKVIDEDTYFGENREEKTCTLVKYENGKLYIKKSATYVKVKNRHDKWRWEKVKNKR